MANKALSFDGTDDYVTVLPTASIEFADEDFTVELWVKATEGNLVTEDRLFCKGSSGAPASGKRYEASVNKEVDKISFVIDDGATKSVVSLMDLTTWADGDWHYLAFRRNVTTNKLEICLDGSQVDQGTDNSGDISSGETLYIGCGYASLGRVGDIIAIIDEVRISSKYRSDAEVLATWNGGSGVKFEVDGDTEALWHIDEDDGVIYDETDNDNDGTIVGATWVDGFPFPLLLARSFGYIIG